LLPLTPLPSGWNCPVGFPKLQQHTPETHPSRQSSKRPRRTIATMAKENV
jgi:hypothetical protein